MSLESGKLFLREEHESRGLDTQFQGQEERGGGRGSGDATILGQVWIGHCPGRKTSRAIYFSVYLLQAEMGLLSQAFTHLCVCSRL